MKSLPWFKRSKGSLYLKSCLINDRIAIVCCCCWHKLISKLLICVVYSILQLVFSTLSLIYLRALFRHLTLGILSSDVLLLLLHASSLKIFSVFRYCIFPSSSSCCHLHVSSLFTLCWCLYNFWHRPFVLCYYWKILGAWSLGSVF